MNDVTEHDEPGRSSPTPAAADISDEMRDEAEKLLGVWLRRDVHWPTQAEAVTDDRIRRWSMYSVGDDNPLYMQPDYAARTIWGTTIAPPSFLYTVDSTIVAPGFRGIQWVYGGTRWTHYRPVRSGDVISARARLIRITEKKGAHVPRFFSQTGETLYTNQRGELVCRAEADVLRVPRRRSGSGIRGFEDRTARWRYSDSDIDEIREHYLAETRRGAEPRYWESVEVGDVLPTRVKGPLTLVDVVAFYVGRGATYNALKFAVQERERHPANVYVSPTTNVPVHPAAGHIDDEIAREIGMPGAYDQGFQRTGWAGHLVTDWAGDWSFVRYLSAKLTIPNIVGDTTWMHGVVSGKSRTDTESVVEIDIWGENQRGERNFRGSATVRLPSHDIRDQFVVGRE